MTNGFDGSLPRIARRLVTLACLATLTACGHQGGDASQVVASVGDDEITESQVNLALEKQRDVKPDQVEATSRRLVNGLVEQDLVLQKARELKLDRDQRVMQNIEAMKRELIASAYVSRIADGASRPSDKDVQAYFDDNPALFAQRRVYSIQELTISASPDQAKEIEAQLKQLKSPSDIAVYLKSRQIPATSSQSTVAAESLPLPLLKRVAALQAGQGLIIANGANLRVLLLLGAQDSPLTVDQARPAITAFLTTQNKRQAIEKELASLRAGAKVAYFGKYADMAASAASAPDARPVRVGSSASSALTSGSN